MLEFPIMMTYLDPMLGPGILGLPAVGLQRGGDHLDLQVHRGVSYSLGVLWDLNLHRQR